MEVGCVGGSGLVKEDIYEGRPGSCVTSAALRTGTETVHFGTCHTNQATGRHPPYVARTRRESLYKQSDTVRVGRLGRFCPFVKPSDTQVEDSVMSVRYEYWNACDFVIVPVRKYNVSIGSFVINPFDARSNALKKSICIKRPTTRRRLDRCLEHIPIRNQRRDA